MFKKIVLCCCLFCLFLTLLYNTSADVKERKAKEVVLLLYDFGSLEQLEEQQKKLHSKVTQDVFNQVTVDNEERRLNTYLKYSGCVSTVHFLVVTDNYIIYRLENATIGSSALYLFAYNIDLTGRIDRIYEAELTSFMAGEEQWSLWDC